MPPDVPGPAESGARFRLMQLATALGEPISSAANLPVDLTDPGGAWFIERGAADVFVVDLQNGEPEAPFRHIVRVEAGRMAFGADCATAGSEKRLMAKGLQDTVLLRVPLRLLAARLAEDTDAEALESTLTADIDLWIRRIAAFVAKGSGQRPRADFLLAADTRVEADGVLTSAHGVIWVQGGGAHAAFLGTEGPGPDAASGMPLTPETWIVLRRRAGIVCAPSRDLKMETLLFRCLPEFHRLAFGAEAINRRLALADQANLQVTRAAWRRQEEAEARRRLFGVLGPRLQPVSASDALLTALRAVGRHEGIVVRAPAVATGEPEMAAILHASNLRSRQVRLVPSDRWWRGDSGAMLAFRREGGRPVALLPGATGGYRLQDPETGAVSRVGRKTAAGLETEAFFLYQPLADDGAIGVRELLGVAGGNAVRTAARVSALSLAAGVLSMAPAAGVGLLIDRIIPSSEPRTLVVFTAILVLFAMAAALTGVLRGTAFMRIEGRTTARITAALWDRLLKLPTGFFRGVSSGEVATRAMAFQALRDRLAGAAGTALVSALFLFPCIAFLFLYDATLGWLILGTGLASLAVTVAFGVVQIEPQRRRFQEARFLAGYLSQILAGVRKLQFAGAEGAARAFWARGYRRQKRAEIHVGRLSEHLAAFSAALPALASAALFAISMQRAGALGIGDFLAVYTASMIFYTSIVALGASFEAIASVVPGSEQARPILEAAPDTASDHRSPAVLDGGLRFEQVSFRYGDAGPPILDGVSLHAEPNEFIAIVGESGAGKSTLMRLALGLEEPTGGAVYYGRQNLAHLDLASVRRQVGVVMQDGGLQTGTVLDNIVGLTESLTVEDAWRAARQAAVDRDIAAMPMGMHTNMGENAATVSGGQGQRVRVAAALARNPRIIFLDEATNWLDAKSQAALMKGIRDAVATRIVIAHRLSTIREAHRIYVIEAGRVVQEGSFDELAHVDGPFRKLIRRQQA